MRPSRRELELRVDEPAAEYSGPAFTEAVKGYADALDEDARGELGEVLLERAGGLEQAVQERFEARGWLRRTWDRAGGNAQRP